MAAKSKKAKATKKEVAVVQEQHVAKVPAPTTRDLVVDLGSLERVLLQGDLSSLNTDDRVDYYKKVCATVGLNPLTKPFEYLVLDKGLCLYATRNCTDQLCSLHRLSVEIVSADERDELMIVRSRITSPDGRRNEAVGVVDLKGLSGKNRANAMMKAETKAKRRAVLSMCGLSFLDEIEIEDLPAKQINSAGSSTLNAMEAKHVAPKVEAKPTVVPETRQITNTPEQRQEVIDVEPETKPEPEPEPKQEKPVQASGKKNSAGTAYPMPPEDVIAHLRERRYIKALTWAERVVNEGEVSDPEAFFNDFGYVDKLIRNYGGAHLKRWEAILEVLGLPTGEK